MSRAFVHTVASDTATLFAAHAKAAPHRPSVWTSGTQPPALDLGSKDDVLQLSSAVRAAEESYGGLVGQ
jgi:hypothetical protein